MNPIIGVIQGLVTGLAKPITGYLSKKVEAKTAVETLKAKATMARDGHGHEQVMTDKDWEAIAKSKEDSSWKDEYSLVLGSSPYALVIVGSVSAAFGYPEILDGALEGIRQLKELDIPVGWIASASILTGLGLKAVRG